MESIPTRIPKALCDQADQLCMPGQSRAGLIAQALRIGLDVLAREEREAAARISEAVTGWPAVRP